VVVRLLLELQAAWGLAADQLEAVGEKTWLGLRVGDRVVAGEEKRMAATLLAEGKDAIREEVLKLRAMQANYSGGAAGAAMSLEVSKDLTLMLQQPYNAAAAARVNHDMMITTSAVTASNHQDAGDAIAAAPARQCPVQLDLLPLRPLSHSITSSRAASPPQSYSTSSKLYFSWQPPSVRSDSRSNSGSGG
jgi:hypothetical protein